jgi:cephalosporin hydroxylase
MIDFLAIAEEAIDVYDAMQKRTELAAFLAFVHGLRPHVVYEIGTATGGTLWAISRVAGANLYVSIDLPGGPFSGGATIEPEALRRLISDTLAREPEVIVLRGDSRTVEIPEGPHMHPDLLLIDGDHSVAGVTADWNRWGPLVLPGGIVAFHDIVPHPTVTGVEVSQLWHEIRRDEPATVELVDPTDLGPAGNQWGGIGIVFR